MMTKLKAAAIAACELEYTDLEKLIEMLKLERDARKEQMNRKLAEGLEVGKEVAARLNYNVTHNIPSQLDKYLDDLKAGKIKPLYWKDEGEE